MPPRKLPDELPQHPHHVVDRLIPQPRIDADPEGLIHHEVGVGEVADPPVLHVRIGGLADEVAGEDRPRGDLPLGQPRDDLGPR